MADYQLTQSGSEVQDILDASLRVSGTATVLTQTGAEVQNILNESLKGKFVWLDATDYTLYDEIPSAGADWFMGWYDTSWSNRPTDYGMIYRMTVGNNALQWAYEYAIAVGGEAGRVFVRTSVNGQAWSSWSAMLSSLRFSVFRDLISEGTIPSQPTSNTTNSFTVPQDGYLFLFADRGSTSGNTLTLYVDGTSRFSFPAYNAYACATILVPLTKGQVITLKTDSTSATWAIRSLIFEV